MEPVPTACASRVSGKAAGASMGFRVLLGKGGRTRRSAECVLCPKPARPRPRVVAQVHDEVGNVNEAVRCRARADWGERASVTAGEGGLVLDPPACAAPGKLIRKNTIPARVTTCCGLGRGDVPVKAGKGAVWWLGVCASDASGDVCRVEARAGRVRVPRVRRLASSGG